MSESFPCHWYEWGRDGHLRRRMVFRKRQWCGRPIKSIEARFWRRVDQSGGPEACWLWLGGVTDSGYARCSRPGGKHVMGHRLSWELLHGFIPTGLLVLHKCDNPPCVNPSHLFLGTEADNTADMLRKGRKAPTHGELNGLTKLSQAQVSLIVQRLQAGEYQHVIALDFAVSKSTIQRIAARETYMARFAWNQ